MRRKQQVIVPSYLGSIEEPGDAGDDNPEMKIFGASRFFTTRENTISGTIGTAPRSQPTLCAEKSTLLILGQGDRAGG
ncbi:uncharacterized protein PADG_11172 [Paracoccidioides brasiliensis Pb18]|uniref:Uncharacterized protein n=1 Tax=Paracoccidioides brasiliensis (strain Pb18) TaxID=502780 RepID=A0A0A0HU93_PARBD|nr:uncharacterized protein PADG_11172 [Paracoccidioides brasiliensis Pb18]KGM92714.1 hypothetical protein PADG_11172 [Paracoccidioides brasiliensis Pb18]ODH49380.1 hypothetical protein GX48_04465 [Paracoccidioides brasiliensis]